MTPNRSPHAFAASLLLGLLIAACTTQGPGQDGGTPDSGELDGAAVDSGVDGGIPDAGPYSVESVFVYGQYNTRISGAIWGGARGLTVLGYGGNSYPFIAWNDGGVWQENGIIRFTDPIGPASVAALSPNEYFLSTQVAPVHLIDDLVVDVGTACNSLVNPESWSGAAASQGEVWFSSWRTGAAAGGRLCRWRRDAGFEPMDSGLLGHTWTTLVDLPDGGMLLGDWAGGVADVGSGQATQVLSSRVVSLFRAGDSIWAAGDELAWYRPETGWRTVDTGSPGALSVWASSDTDVWVVGNTVTWALDAGQWTTAGTSFVTHFDGTQWARVSPIPGLPDGGVLSFVSGSGPLLLLGGHDQRGTSLIDVYAMAIVLRR